MKHMFKLLLCASAAAGIVQALPAHAESGLPIVTSIESNYVGLGLGVVPDYWGSDDYTGAVLPAFRYNFGDHRNIELIGNYLSANLVNDDVISFGPALRYRFGRDDDVDDEVVARLPEIDDAVEVGFTLSAQWILNNNPRNRFNVGIDTLFDVSGTSDGFNSTLSARYWMPVSTSFDIGLGGALQYGSDDFNDTYFGVSPTGSARSGLPRFSADGGFNSVDIQPMAVYHINNDWHVGAGVRFSRLIGDASDSPIVDGRGDTNQILAAVGVVYSWGAKVNTR